MRSVSDVWSSWSRVISHTERRTRMELGPLEYVVLGFEDEQFANEVLPELNTIQASGMIQVVDLLFVSKTSDGTVVVQEVSELGDEELTAYEGLSDDLAGLFTAEDVQQLAGEVPAGMSAVIVLL